MSYLVSRLTTDHVDAVLDLETLVFSHENNGESIAQEKSKRWLSCFIALDQEIPYGVFDGGDLVCSVIARDKNPGLTSCFSIEAVNTHPDYRRLGLASRALSSTLKEIEQKAPEREPFLFVPRDNRHARALYTQFGFVARSEEAGYINDGIFYIRMDRAQRTCLVTDALPARKFG